MLINLLFKKIEVSDLPRRYQVLFLVNFDGVGFLCPPSLTSTVKKMKLGDHKNSKVTELVLSGRLSFAQKRAKRAQNGLNMDFFVNFSKLCHYFFLIFFMKLGYHKHFSQKSVQKWLKWTVSIISQNGLKVKVIFFSDILHEVKGT